MQDMEFVVPRGKFRWWILGTHIHTDNFIQQWQICKLTGFYPQKQLWQREICL